MCRLLLALCTSWTAHPQHALTQSANEVVMHADCWQRGSSAASMLAPNAGSAANRGRPPLGLPSCRPVCTWLLLAQYRGSRIADARRVPLVQLRYDSVPRQPATPVPRSEALQGLIRWMLAWAPLERPTMAQVLREVGIMLHHPEWQQTGAAAAARPACAR